MALGAVGSAAADKYSWEEVPSPTGSTIYGAVQTQEGPYAVGSSGDVFARRVDGWEMVLDDGPTTQSNPLRACDVTSDGRNLWFAGGSGVVGQYDVFDEQLTDYSAPKGKTSTWEAVAAAGSAGSEFVGLANGSGEFLPGTKNDQGGMNWGTVVKPGGGSSIKGMDFLDKQVGYVCDTNAKVYETTDGGKSWTTIGIDGGSVGLYGIAAVSRDRIYVTGGDGSIFRYNGAVWTKTDAGGTALLDIEFEAGEGLASGGSGNLYEYRDREGWSKEDTPMSATLRGVALDPTSTFPDVAVGSSGTIIERGLYTASEPKDNELIVDGSKGSDERVKYRVSVDGATEGVPNTTEDTDEVDSDVLDGSVVTGRVRGGLDRYRFSGSITDFTVTSGSPAEIYVVVNGDVIDVTDGTN
ncbi:hypothetical protein BRC86_13705 [Halobacteriales archaeon QS_3_64_16]|nr:MAG: hypothetical protein BRC86_13705 [Halobacteriales archaeon QS_3_64_16]